MASASSTYPFPEASLANEKNYNYLPCVFVCMCHGVNVEVRGHLQKLVLRVDCKPWVSHLGCQGWQLEALLKGKYPGVTEQAICS